LRKDR